MSQQQPSRAQLSAAAQVLGLMILAGGVAVVRWWIGLIVLGVGLMAIGVAEERA